MPTSGNSLWFNLTVCTKIKIKLLQKTIISLSNQNDCWCKNLSDFILRCFQSPLSSRLSEQNIFIICFKMFWLLLVKLWFCSISQRICCRQTRIRTSTFVCTLLCVGELATLAAEASKKFAFFSLHPLFLFMQHLKGSNQSYLQVNSIPQML